MSRPGAHLAAVRPPAVAGTFYPGEAATLQATLARLLADAPLRVDRRPKALVVPHAGYVYSGPTAAIAYAQLRAPGPRVERVVLLGPAHHVAVAGLALPEAGTFLTPLGRVPLDEEAARVALRLPQVTRSALAHALEHSLEVQLPFLQQTLGAFSLVPFAVGRASPSDVAEVLAALWGGPETLVVISTDLSHYLPYAEAQDLDQLTAAQILALDADGLRPEQACGRTPLSGLLKEGRRLGLEVVPLDLRNSGDTAGDRDSVVGYGAFALMEPAPGATRRQGEARHRAAVITGIARSAIARALGLRAPPPPALEPWLLEPRACFVSLHRDGLLRGCIGSTEPRGALHEEVARCAVAAAVDDPRFPPVGADEFEDLEVDVSVLSPLELIEADDEAAALKALRPGLDGLSLEAFGRRAVFIPAVWEQLPSPGAFLSSLRRKAGLPDQWLPGTRLSRFTAEQFKEAR